MADPAWLEVTKAVLGFASAAAWPGAAIVIATRFRVPISNAIERARKFSAFGAQADLAGGTAQQVAEVGGPTELVPRGLASVPVDPPADELLAPVEASISGLLEKEPLTVEQRSRWAVRVAAINAIAYRHEQHYRLIYGSQIAFLRELNSSVIFTFEQARVFFDSHMDKIVVNAAYTFENWLAFMISWNDVVSTTGPDGVARLEITPLGRAFLAFLVSNGIPEGKPF